MLVWIARWVLSALALYIVSQIVPGVRVTDFPSAMIAVIVIALVNMFVKPILFLLTLPVTILTLGLFTFVLNALLLMLAGAISPGLEVDGFGAALLGSLLYSIISTLLLALVQ